MPSKSPKRGRPIAPAQNWAVPWESLLRGVGKTTRRVSETTPGPSRKSVAAKQNTRGKRKSRQEKPRKTLAASRPKRSLRRFKENPKTHGAQAEENARSGTHGQNGRHRQKRRDTKEKRNSKTGACEGVSCYYLNCLSRKKPRKTTSTEKPKEERTKPKTPDLTSREFFPTLSGANRQEIKQKHRQKTTKKHQTNSGTQKQKFAPEIFSKSDPKKRRTAKKRQKTPNQTRRTQKKKRTAFPPSKRGKKRTLEPDIV